MQKLNIKKIYMKGWKNIISIILLFIVFSLLLRPISIMAFGFSNPGTSGDSISATLQNVKDGWLPDYVGLKINIVPSDGVVRPRSEYVNLRGMIFNNEGLGSGEVRLFNYSGYNNEIKVWNNNFTEISDPKNWKKSSSYVNRSSSIPSSWEGPGGFINLKEELVGPDGAEDYVNLEQILIDLFGKSTIDNLKNDDYIVVEPMIRIGNLYGTTSELLYYYCIDNQVDKVNYCSKNPDGTFKTYVDKNQDAEFQEYIKYFDDMFGGILFYGNSNHPTGGMLYNTIYLENSLYNIGLSASIGKGVSANQKLSSMVRNTSGESVGVFKVSDMRKTKTPKLIKLDKDNDTIKLGGATFEIYEGTNCNRRAGRTYTTATRGDDLGTVVLEGLTSGVYSIKETVAPGNPSNPIFGNPGSGGISAGDYESNSNNLGCIVPSLEIGKASSGENYEYDGKATLKIYNSKSGKYKIEKYKKVYKDGKIVKELLTDIPVKFNIYTDSSCTKDEVPYTGKYSYNKNGIISAYKRYEVEKLGYECKSTSDDDHYFNEYYCSKKLGFVTTSGGSVQFDLPNDRTTYYIKEVYSGDIVEEYEENKACIELKSPIGNKIQTTKVTNDHKTILKIIKSGSDNKYLKGAKFNIYSGKDCSGSSIASVETDTDGEAIADVKTAGWYSIKETNAPTGYIKSDKCYPVYVNKMSTKEITVTNEEKPIIKKVDRYDKQEINKSVTFEVYDDSSCGTDSEYFVDIVDDSDYAAVQFTYTIGRQTDDTDLEEWLSEEHEYGNVKIKYSGNYDCVLEEDGDSKDINDYLCRKTPINSITFTGHAYLPSYLSKDTTYYIKEISAPDGYKFKENDDDEAPCLSIKYGSTTTVENWTSCSIEFDSINKNSMEERVRLYRKYDLATDKNIKCTDCNGLLDLSITEGSKACKHYSCSGNSNTSCLSGSYGNKTYDNKTFSESNIACFNETYTTTDGNGIAYCLSTFNLVNNLGTTTFGTKSGRMPIQKLVKSEAVPTTGTFKHQCYIYYNGNESVSEISTPKYSNYIGSIKLGDSKLQNDKLTEATGSDRKIETESKDHWYSYTETVKYYLNPVYAKNGTGEISKTQKDSTYKRIGYGVVSKFQDDSQYVIPFSVTLNSRFPEVGNKTYTATTNKCIVNPDQEIIITDPDPKNPDELNVEFRIIDTTNPFPGISGVGRIVGTNWSYGGDNTVTNQTVQTVMNRNNSYNKNKQAAKYKITLTPDLVKQIREYNKSNKYDDYTLKCTNGENCTSDFLRTFGVQIS